MCPTLQPLAFPRTADDCRLNGAPLHELQRGAAELDALLDDLLAGQMPTKLRAKSGSTHLRVSAGWLLRVHYTEGLARPVRFGQG